MSFQHDPVTITPSLIMSTRDYELIRIGRTLLTYEGHFYLLTYFSNAKLAKILLFSKFFNKKIRIFLKKL